MIEMMQNLGSCGHTILLKGGGLFLFLFVILNRIFALPEIIPTIFALIWILYVPFGVGRLLLRLPIKPIKSFSHYVNSIGYANILIKWFIGVIIIVSVSFVVTSIGHLSILNIIGLSFLLISISSDLPFRNKAVTKVSKPLVTILIVGLILGLSFGLYVRSFSPYPLSPGMDTFTQIYTIKNVINGTIGKSPLVYFPTLDTLIALGSETYNADLLGIFWSGSILLFIIFAISTLVMSYWITRNYVYAFICTVIGLALTEQGQVSNLQFFYPSSFVMVLFPVLFFVFDSIRRKAGTNKLFPSISGLIVFLGLILIHSYLGLVASFVLLLYLVILYFIQKSSFYLFTIRVATVTLSVILLLLISGISTLQITSFQFQTKLLESTHMDTTQVKIRNLNEWYTKEITIIGLLGLISLSQFKDKKVVAFGFLGCLLLYIFFQQFAVVLRIMTLERPLLSFAAASFIILPLVFMFNKHSFILFRNRLPSKSEQEIPSIARRLFTKAYTAFDSGWLEFFSLSSQRIRKTSIIFVLIVTILLFPVLMRPFDIYIGAYTDKGYAFVNLTHEEIKAAKWIEKNTPRNYYIYSDPFTVIEMRGLAFRNNIEGIGWNVTVANLVKSALTSQNAAEARDKISSHAGDKTLIVITPRTSLWLNKPGKIAQSTVSAEYFIMSPIEKFEVYNGFNNLLNNKYFDLKYRTENIFVFTMNKNNKLGSSS